MRRLSEPPLPSGSCRSSRGCMPRSSLRQTRGKRPAAAAPSPLISCHGRDICLFACLLLIFPSYLNLPISLSLFLFSRLLIRFAGCLLPCCVGDACLLASTHGDLFATRMYPSCVNVMQGRQALIVRERKDFACLVCSDTVRTTVRERDLPLPLYPASSSRLSSLSLSLSVCQ